VTASASGRWNRIGAWLERARGESVAVAVARLLSSGCALVVAAISARQLGPGGRGEIVFVVTVAILCSEFVSLGANVTGRIHILRRSDVLIEDYLGLTTVLLGLQALLVTLILMTIGPTQFGLDRTTCLLGVVLGVVMFFAHMMVDAAFAIRRTLETGIRDMIIGVLPMFLVGLVVLRGQLSVSLVIGFTAMGYAVGGAYLWRVVRRRTDRIRFVPSRWSPLLRSGIPVLAGSLGQTVAFRADRLLVGLLSTSAALGVYSIAATAAELPRILLIPITQIIANRVAIGDITVRSVLSLVRRLALVYGVLMVGVGVVGAAIITPIVGPGFEAVSDSIVVLAFSEGLLGLFFVSASVLTGLGLFRRLPAPSLCGAVVIVVADIIVVPRFGGSGAAWVRVAGFGLMALVAGTLALVSVRVTPDNSS
jgi:O-antigen/teichoic acid export membrane protein